MKNSLVSNHEKEIAQEVYLMKEISEILKSSKDFKIKITSKGWFKVKEPIIINKILRAFGEDITRQILVCLLEHPSSATKLKLKTKHPRTTIYRKLDELEKDGFVKIKAYQENKTKKTAIYESTIKEIKLDFKNNVNLYIRVSG